MTKCSTVNEGSIQETEDHCSYFKSPSLCSLSCEQPEFRPEGTERVIVQKNPPKNEWFFVFNEEMTDVWPF
jgi:hypothetical protein